MIYQPNLLNRAFAISFFPWTLFEMHFHKVSITFKKLFTFWKKLNHLKLMRIYLFIYLFIIYLFILFLVGGGGGGVLQRIQIIMLLSWSLKNHVFNIWIFWILFLPFVKNEFLLVGQTGLPTKLSIQKTSKSNLEFIYSKTLHTEVSFNLMCIYPETTYDSLLLCYISCAIFQSILI